MKWAIAFAGAALCGFIGYRVGSQGDLWLGLSILGPGGVFLLTAAALDHPEPAMPTDSFEPWRQSGFFPNNAPTVSSFCPSRETDTSRTAGAIGAAPANRKR